MTGQCDWLPNDAIVPFELSIPLGIIGSGRNYRESQFPLNVGMTSHKHACIFFSDESNKFYCSCSFCIMHRIKNIDILTFLKYFFLHVPVYLKAKCDFLNKHQIICGIILAEKNIWKQCISSDSFSFAGLIKCSNSRVKIS